jgi:hypothetical protein
MQIDIQKFKATAEAAKAKTTDKRWRAAIDKAVAGVESGWWVITELADCVAITTETGETYFANGRCQCEAFRRNQPCKHRTAARLIELYNERMAARRVATATVLSNAASACPQVERAALIASIEATWSRKHQHEHLADALISRFGCNKLEMLNIDFLRRIQVALE